MKQNTAAAQPSASRASSLASSPVPSNDGPSSLDIEPRDKRPSTDIERVKSASITPASARTSQDSGIRSPDSEELATSDVNDVAARDSIERNGNIEKEDENSAKLGSDEIESPLANETALTDPETSIDTLKAFHDDHEHRILQMQADHKAAESH